VAGLGTSEILIILLVVLLLFGSTKLPQLARSLGKSARILRTEAQSLHGDEPDDRPAPPARAASPHDEETRPRRQASLPPARPLRGTPREAGDTRPAH
jgi:sec-independent protein translocase protein TatA